MVITSLILTMIVLVMGWIKDYLIWSEIMQSVKDLYRPACLSAKNLKNKKIKGKIEAVYVETMGKGKDKEKDKLVIEIEQGETRIALNKTNAVVLAKAFGDDYSKWVGKPIIVQTMETTYMGDPVLGLQVIPGK